MASRRPCPPAPGRLEEYAARFDDVFATLAQRRGFRECLAGLLAPRDRNKTITCLAGAEPVDGAGSPAVQRLQFFISESTWDAELEAFPKTSSAGSARKEWRRAGHSVENITAFFGPGNCGETEITRLAISA